MPRNPLAFLDAEVWTTRDGRQMRPEEMETDHIRNVLTLLARGATSAVQDVYLLCLPAMWVDPEQLGDGAADALALEQRQALDQPPVEWMQSRTIYTALARELAAREAPTDAV